MKNFYFVILFISLATSACTHPTEDRFNLMFKFSDTADFVWSSKSAKAPMIDSAEFINSKYPIFFEAQKLDNMLFDHFKIWYLKIALFQLFVMPSKFYDKDVEISIHNKCIAIDSLQLKISGINSSGDVVKTDSLDINNDNEWEYKTLKIRFENIEYFTISLVGGSILKPMFQINEHSLVTDADGKVLRPEEFEMLMPEFEKRPIPRLYLDRISITIEGKDINQIQEINNLCSYEKEKLIPEYVHPLSCDTDLIKNMQLKNKKIIALGETVHGSENINETVFLLAQHAILHNNCKWILTELELASTLKLNLFTQGKLPEEEISTIREEMRENHLSMKAFTDFLLWLREYNKTVDKKVVILGLLDQYDFIEAPLYDYIFAFYNEEHKKILLPLLKHLHKRELIEAYDLVTQHSEKIKQILGENEFSFFNHALSNLAAIERKQKDLVTVDNYDYNMWTNAETFISMYPQPDETVLIYAHYEHVKKKEGTQQDPCMFVLGNYLNARYKDDYSVVGLTVGSGNITTREMLSHTFTTTNLEKTSAGSFEAMCLYQKDSCFYYPSDRLPHNIYLIRHIGNKENVFKNNVIYSCLKANTNGFIFIRNSNSFKDDDPVYEGNFFWDKALKRAAFLKGAGIN